MSVGHRKDIARLPSHPETTYREVFTDRGDTVCYAMSCPCAMIVPRAAKWTVLGFVRYAVYAQDRYGFAAR